MSTGYILVTGSRSAVLQLRREVAKELSRYWAQAQADGCTHLVIVHGDASGVDSTAAAWAYNRMGLGVFEKAIPADWEAPCVERCKPGHRKPRKGGGTYCPSQGGIRNQKLVRYVLQQYKTGTWVRAAAFYATPNSRGTLDCVRRIREHGMEDVLQEFGNAPKRKEKERAKPVREVPEVRPTGPDKLRRHGS